MNTPDSWREPYVRPQRTRRARLQNSCLADGMGDESQDGAPPLVGSVPSPGAERSISPQGPWSGGPHIRRRLSALASPLLPVRS